MTVPVLSNLSWYEHTQKHNEKYAIKKYIWLDRHGSSNV